ncbi:monovalent cation/H+ antiporter complex subunit F [Rhodopila sp.]|jgi:multicomponent Na+:H+ antiporter subunit F|uniref:monovalent cation/H+ antiporter complex subunit F n=1 Tax=Rhodopila sp. TaxID=2480087 RepID=UPI002BDDA5E8|nr:monovalent cation/H+ antiporter complex subunit F [Rhodopila sp.]HVZ08593.1 monovalent cation/H+ antiporter complex subunit F [Rhodopila sp.]
MPEFLLIAAAVILLMVAIGLVRILRGPSDFDRMMAAQLLGTGGIAALLLLGIATGLPGSVDLALVLALLAVFVAVVFVRGLAASPDPSPRDAEVRR